MTWRPSCGEPAAIPDGRSRVNCELLALEFQVQESLISPLSQAPFLFVRAFQWALAKDRCLSRASF